MEPELPFTSQPPFTLAESDGNTATFINREGFPHLRKRNGSYEVSIDRAVWFPAAQCRIRLDTGYVETELDQTLDEAYYADALKACGVAESDQTAR